MVEYTFKVKMGCSGCANKIKNALSKLEGVESIVTDVEKQTVVVQTELPRDKVLECIKATGKKILDE